MEKGTTFVALRVRPRPHGLPRPRPLRALLVGAPHPSWNEACHEIRDIETRVKQVERQLEAMAQQPPVVAHLLPIPGVGS